MLKRREFQRSLLHGQLDTMVSKSHPLVKLSKVIEWNRIESKLSKHYNFETGRPGVSIRALSGLMILKYLYGLSDKESYRRLLETPVWQYFCGYINHFNEQRAPFDVSMLSVFRKRMGEEGVRELFEVSVTVALDLGLMKPSELKKLHVDTTVQEKNVAYPHSAKLLTQMISKLRKNAKKKGILLKQGFTFVSRRLCVKALRYSNARQFKRMHRCIRKLATCLGRMSRDIARKIYGDEVLEAYFKPLLEQAIKVGYQSTHKVASNEYIYSLHEPEVACIAKGKAYKKYEFGSKVSIAITDKSKVIVGCDIFKGNPHDSKTLRGVVENIKNKSSLTEVEAVGVDLGYRGSKVVGAVHARLKKLSLSCRNFIRSHPKIEAVISLSKRKFLLGKSRLKGFIGDTINCVMSSVAYNFALILRRKFAW